MPRPSNPLPPQAVERLPPQALEHLPPELQPGPTYRLEANDGGVFTEGGRETISLSLYPSQDVTERVNVTVRQSGGTATLDEDYSSGRSSNSLVPGMPGPDATYFVFFVKDDAVAEPTETVVFSAYNRDTGALLASTTVTILDNDAPAAASADLSPLG